jgi:hypothetical protein
MTENLFSLREKEIFETLKKIKNFNFVLIGGYAVTSYTLPRFSVDCDIVVKDDEDIRKIERELILLGYKKEEIDKTKLPYSGNFERFEKILANNFKVSMDILINEVSDRQTGIAFSAEWVFENSETRSIKGKTINEELKLRIANPDALMVMKISSCRINDIRDVFMLSVHAKDKDWIKNEISNKYDFNKLFLKIKEKITSKQFKDSLQGVYGIIDNKIFEKHKKAVLGLGKIKDKD